MISQYNIIILKSTHVYTHACEQCKNLKLASVFVGNDLVPSVTSIRV